MCLRNIYETNAETCFISVSYYCLSLTRLQFMQRYTLICVLFLLYEHAQLAPALIVAPQQSERLITL